MTGRCRRLRAPKAVRTKDARRSPLQAARPFRHLRTRAFGRVPLARGAPRGRATAPIRGAFEGEFEGVKPK